MSPWWWVLIGFAAWFIVSLAVGRWLGPALRRSSQAREAIEAQMGEIPAGRDEPPEDGPLPQNGQPTPDGQPPQDGQPPRDGPTDRLETSGRGHQRIFGGVPRGVIRLPLGVVLALG
jgi:hypothetical protein